MLSRRIATQAARAAAPRAAIAPRVAIRHFAAPASPVSTKPPVALFGIDGTYASALYTAAAKTSSLEPTAKALEALGAIFKREPRLEGLISAPTLSVEDKKEIVAQLQKQIGAEGDAIVNNFLNTLAENNRLGALSGVCDKFAQLISAHRGEVELVITSAAPLEPRTLRQLETSISKSRYVGQGKKLKVVSKINPDIKGGLIVEIGDRTIDLSVSAKMAKLNQLLREAL